MYANHLLTQAYVSHAGLWFLFVTCNCSHGISYPDVNVISS